MMQDLSVATKTKQTYLDTIEASSDSAKQYIINSLAESTRRAYKSDLAAFKDYCDELGLTVIPALPSTVSNFLASQADKGYKASTLTRRVAAIKYAHELSGHDSPTDEKAVKQTLSGIRRTIKTKPVQKSAATSDKIDLMIEQCDTSTLIGKRDKALLLLGFAGAFRRSELAALKVSDIEFTNDGLKVTIRESKTDQTGEGEVIGIPLGRMNVPLAVKEWLAASEIESGYLFRGFYRGGKSIRDTMLSGQAIADVIKAYAVKLGLNPEDYAGHSLRSGFITSAAKTNANVFKIMDVSRHRSVQTVKRYVRDGELFDNHAADGFL